MNERVKRERLSAYVARAMRQKGLRQKDIVLRSGGEIAGGYISDIVNGKVTNLSMDKFKALARGLGVNVIELFAAACGEQEGLTAADSLMLLDLMQHVVVSPALMEILRLTVSLSPAEQEAVLNNIRALIEFKEKVGRRKKRG